ncbi:MAG: HesB/IscA family protein [Gammaproteobacteria bacterium]
MIHLTEAAAAHIKSVLAKSPAAVGLRIGVKKTGCSGYGYIVDLVESVTPDDKVFEDHGVTVVVKEADLAMFDGTSVDFVTEGLNRHFKFDNPKADHYCGCGESFTLKASEEGKDNGH